MIKVTNFDVCFDTKRVKDSLYVWRIFNTADLKNPIKTAENALNINELVCDLEFALMEVLENQGYNGKPIKLFK